MRKKEKIYFISQFDSQIHNINDVEHRLVSEELAYIGKDCGIDGLRVDEEVDLYTIEEVIKFETFYLK